VSGGNQDTFGVPRDGEHGCAGGAAEVETRQSATDCGAPGGEREPHRRSEARQDLRDLPLGITIGGGHAARLRECGSEYLRPRPDVPLQLRHRKPEPESEKEKCGAEDDERRTHGKKSSRDREERLHSERLASIGQMMSGVLHDLKTPMTIVSGYAQLMASSDDGEQRNHYAELILKQFDLMSSMTRELLQFARGESQLLVRKVYLQNWLPEVRAQLERDRDIHRRVRFGELARAVAGGVVEHEHLALEREALALSGDRVQRSREQLADGPPGAMVRLPVEHLRGHPHVHVQRADPAHLDRLEGDLKRTQSAVASLRDLLQKPAPAAHIGHRKAEKTAAAAFTRCWWYWPWFPPRSFSPSSSREVPTPERGRRS